MKDLNVIPTSTVGKYRGTLEDTGISNEFLNRAAISQDIRI
jgi:hypothetical protein